MHCTPILTTGVLTSSIGSSKQAFTYEGKSHDAVLKWGGRSFRSIPYTLEIDGASSKRPESAYLIGGSDTGLLPLASLSER